MGSEAQGWTVLNEFWSFLLYFLPRLFCFTLGQNDAGPGQICANLLLFRVLWGLHLSNPLWLKQILLFVLWLYLEEKTSGSDCSFRDTALERFLTQVHSHQIQWENHWKEHWKHAA